MRIVCISDTHNRLGDVEVPAGDLLLHAGDHTLSFKGSRVKDHTGAISALASLPHKHKVFIAGNHDFEFQTNGPSMREFVGKFKNSGLYYLEHETIELEINSQKIKIFGSPWQPWFYNWAFNLSRGPALAKKWDEIPQDVDIVLTHTPAHGTLDRVGNEHVGCEELATRLAIIKPRLHVSGHIHCGYGEAFAHGTHYVNAALVNNSYKIVNDPIVVDICRDCGGDHLVEFCAWTGPTLEESKLEKESI